MADTGLMAEPLLTLSQAASKYPGHRGADRMHPATLTRWILKGVKGPGGRVVKLEAFRVGTRWLTSEAALARFVIALTPHVEDHGDAPVRTPGERRRASERAADILIRARA